MIILFFGSAILLLFLGVPMAVTLGLSSILYILVSGTPPTIIIQTLFSGVDVSALMAIPFFILAGDLMLTGGLAQRILDLANAMVGKRTGGLAIVTIIGCMFFAAISGSAIATAAALGSIMIPAMVDKGYDRDFASAVVASASPMGVIIPPSITFIIYGTLANTSVSDLYIVGIPGGIIFGIALTIVAYLVSKKHGYKGSGHPFSIKEFFVSLFRAFWALGTPVILIGGVFSGIFTPTESGVVAVAYAIIIGLFVYRELKFKDLWKIFFQSAKTTSSIMFIIANASLFAYIMAYEQIPQAIVSSFMSISESPIIILLMINIILLLFGAFMDTIAVIVIVVPMFLPVITTLGIDPVLFGLIVVVNTAIGMATPPFGATLFISSSVGNVPFHKVAWRVLAPVGAAIIALFIITYIPEVVMFWLK
ncbi:MAG TPA: TRAP transporter large permease [Virgibacillus sp.]|nr:TRAP transporter large permease [Virgibacillus sp.]HLR68265.1 TRAP transporter large permease [Virgibacillus sp.]